MSLGMTIGKKAAKRTVKVSARGMAAKAQRKPLRSATLLTIGIAIGGTIGWLAARKTQAGGPQPV